MTPFLKQGLLTSTLSNTFLGDSLVKILMRGKISFASPVVKWVRIIGDLSCIMGVNRSIRLLIAVVFCADVPAQLIETGFKASAAGSGASSI